MGCACISEKDNKKNNDKYNIKNNNKINFKSKKNKIIKKNNSSISNSNNLSNLNNSNNNNNNNNSLNNKKINESLNNNNNEINEINTNINKNNFNKEENNNNNKSITLNNSLNSTKPEKIIKCNINYNSKIISQQIFSKNNINNLKEKLNKEYFKNNNNKKLNFYYKGKLLNEEEKIENIFSTFNENFDLLSNYNNENNNNDSLTLNMISLSLNNNDNSLNEENFNSESVEKKSSITNEYYSKLINKLSSFCEEHSNKKLLFICFLCKKSLCELDLEEHKQHKIIKKIDLINLNKELNIVKDEIEENVNSIGLKNNIENNNNYFFNHSCEIFKDIKNEILKIKNDNDEIIENINKQYRIIDEDFQKNFDNNFPLTLEFIEKINNINNEINDLETFKDENNFIEIYNKAFFIKNEKEKIINNINILKEILNNYKLNLENFKKNKEKLNKILIKSYNLMFNKINEDEKNSFFKDFEITSKNNNNNNNLNSNWFNKSLISKSSKNGGKPKLNLLNLMSSQNDKKTLLKNIENNYKEKKNLKQSSLNNYNYDNNNNLNFSSSNNLNFDLNNNFENNEINNNNNNNNIKFEIDNKFNEINNNNQNKKKNNNNDFINDIDNNRYETVTENSKSNQETTNNIINSKEININPNNLIYSLLYGSEKIIFYNISTGTLNAKDVDLSDTKLKHFETYISHLSFKGKLYISGGFITAKNFFEYDFKKNKFFKLTDMINSHSYHCMLGYKNNIFVISGYKSKKIESFNINNKTWKNLPDLNYSRSYSNSIVINDNLFVFGNINEIVNKTIIEKLNIDFNDEENLKWEIFEINEIIPFYSGMIYDNRNNENLIIVGGKFDDKEESKKDIYNLNIKDLTVNKLDYVLDEQEEFNGKMFIPLYENQNNESINESDFSRDENDFNCNKFGLFSEINPCVFYIYNINDCLFERKEFEENVI